MQYEATHPFISFRLEEKGLNYRTWMLLGEAQSKAMHLAGVPLKPSLAQELHRVYLAKGINATTAIEGNTLTENEVLLQIEGKLSVPQSKKYLVQEVENIKQAFELIGNSIKEDGTSQQLTIDQIKEFNQLILRDIPVEEHVVPGQIRNINLVVGKYRCPPHEECDYLLGRFCEWMNNFPSPPGLELVFSIIKAIYAHLYFVWIHPFGDGNGRTARLIEYKLLLFAGVPTPAAHLLSNFYNQTRNSYYQHLDIAKHDINQFTNYALQGFVDGLKEQILLIRNQQWDVSWINYIYECFEDSGKAAKRQRDILIALTYAPEDGVPIEVVPILTPKLAKEYKPLNPRTVDRDIRELQESDFVSVKKDSKGIKRVKAKKEKILAFLPLCKDDTPIYKSLFDIPIPNSDIPLHYD
jgi:Fic family protein